MGLPGLSKAEIAARLRQAGLMLRLGGEGGYRAGAYEAGADAVEALAADLPALVDGGRLTEFPSIGTSLAAVITDLVRTGRSGTLERIVGDFPVGLLELSRLPGMTMRRLRLLHAELGVLDAEGFRQALDAGALETLKGFGPKTASRLRAALDQAATAPERWVLVNMLEWAPRLVKPLRRQAGVLSVEVVGSVRRWSETAGDINLLASSHGPEAVIDDWLRGPAVSTVLARQPGFCRVRLVNGMAVTLAVVAPARLAAALVAGIGSRAHVERLRGRAAARGLALDAIEADSEAAIYDRLGLPLIPPELREDAGELEAADGGDTFADLITEGDILGMVHCHSTYSDGRHTIAEMAAAAAALGKTYLTVTDHSPAASYAGGVPIDRLAEQAREIAAAQAETGVRLLRGTESDILKDGGLDYPPDVLSSLEIVIASIHERFRMDREAMTERLARAMAQPVFKIWGHALGRLLLRRPPIDCDVERILDVVAASRAAIEVNGSPYRLDLPAVWIRAARRRGIKFVVSTDAHSTGELGNLRFGIAEARRGGLRRGDVLNTLPAAAFVQAVRP